jgi:hypothetical protein
VSVVYPERDELPAGHVAADHDLVVAVGIGVAEVLHAEVVLVGEEVGQPVVGCGLSEHGLGGDDRLVQCVGPVLDAELAAQQRVVGVGDVACGEDVVVGGAQVLVGEDAVVDVEPAGSGQFDVGGDADADDDDVGGQFRAVRE